MVTIKALDELTLADLWREVPLEEEVWSVVRAREQLALKHLLQGALEEELVEQLAASRYRRTEVRRGYRNGCYERDLVTQLGVISGIRVPRARGRVERQVFRRYQRRQGVIDALIREMFLAGISTRRVGQVLRVLLGEPVSAQTVSRLARSLDQEVARFHEAFLHQLRERGLAGRRLKLIVTDGCPGLHQALETVYPYVPRQRCWVHKLRNVANLLKRSQQQECLAGARAIYLAATRREAVRAYWAWAQRWREEAPKAVACLERVLEELLNVLACPEAHRRKVRTTNAIERAFREVRRRTRPMSCFTNSASCERIIYAVISHLNKSWEGKMLPEFTQE